MTTLVLLALGNESIAVLVYVIGGFAVLAVLRGTFGRADQSQPGSLDRPMGAATRLRRYRDCRVVKCPRRYCQAMNVQRARFCRHCGAPLN